MTVLITLIVTLLASATGLMILFSNLADDDVYGDRPGLHALRTRGQDGSTTPRSGDDRPPGRSEG